MVFRVSPGHKSRFLLEFNGVARFGGAAKGSGALYPSRCKSGREVYPVYRVLAELADSALLESPREYRETVRSCFLSVRPAQNGAIASDYPYSRQ